MKEYTIYTCGKMSGLSLDEQMGWRVRFEKAMRSASPRSSIRFVHPPFFYNYEDDAYYSQEEVKRWELGTLRDKCDIVVVNLDGINESVGSHYELAVIDTLPKFVPVIGIGDPDGVHPWILDSILRIEDDCYAAADYIAAYCIL